MNGKLIMQNLQIFSLTALEKLSIHKKSIPAQNNIKISDEPDAAQSERKNAIIFTGDFMR